MLENTQPTSINRYRILEKLGHGGMGAVYKAHDRLTNQMVALKQVLLGPADLDFASRADTDTDLHIALAEEFRTLASLRHPNIISVLDYGFGRDRQPYFTMNYLEHGRTIVEVAEDATEDSLVTLLIHLLLALSYLHRRNIIHRDLKPDNVMVIDGQVKVLDFGLAVLRRDSAPSRTDTAAGTIAYIAPEMFEGLAASQTADLYAVGVIAYELFAGKHPFDTSNMMVLMREIMMVEADVDSIGLSGALATVLKRLLIKDPDARYANANDVIRDLCAATNRPIPRETAAIRDSYIQAAKFVGRDAELQRLEHLLNHTLDNRGGLVLVGGESGIGKTRLLQELRIRALVNGMLVIHGQAIAEGGSPYQIWRNVLRSLVIYTRVTDEEASVLKPLVPDIADLLEHDIPDPPSLDSPEETQQRLRDVIETVFIKQTQPIMLMLEDLQWADESLAILRHLSKIAPELPLLIVGNYRNDERPDLPKVLDDADVVILERFTLDHIAELSVSMLGESGKQPHIVQLLHNESEGNVFFLIEVVRALAEEAGKLDEIGRMTLPDQIFARGVKTIVERRLRQVSDRAYHLLQLASIAGRQVDLNIIQNLVSEVNLDNWLTMCGNASILDFQENTWRFNHDKLREYLLDTIPNDQRAGMYEQVAEAVEVAYPDSPNYYVTLAALWHETNNHAKDLHYAALGGKLSFETSSYLIAIDLLNRALILLRALPEVEENLHQQLDLQVPLAIALRNAVGYTAPEFIEAVNQAWELLQLFGDTAEMTLASSQILWQKWLAHTSKGELDTAWLVAQEFYKAAEKTQNPAFIIEGHRQILATSFYSGRIQTCHEHIDKLMALYDHEKHSRSAISRYGQDPAATALSYSCLPRWLLGYPEQAMQTAQRATDLAESIGDPTTSSLVLLFVNYPNYLKLDLVTAHAESLNMLRLAEQHNLALWKALATGLHGWTTAKTGSPLEGIQQLRQSIRVLESAGVGIFFTISYVLLIDAYGSALDPDEGVSILKSAFNYVDQKGEHVMEAELHRLQGRFLLEKGDPQAAETAYETSIAIAQDQSAKWWELRTTTALARLWHSQGKHEEAYARLVTVYDWFTEGFEFQDLQEAKGLLDQLV